MYLVERIQEEPFTPPFDDSNSNPIPFPLPHTMDEWEILSQIRSDNNIHIDDLEMLGHCDFDKNHNWTHENIPTHLHETMISFIDLNRLSTQLHEDTQSLSNSHDSLSPTQCIAFDLVISHFRYSTPSQPLKMVI